MTNAYTSQQQTAVARAKTRVSKMRPIDQLALFDALLGSLPLASFRELKIKSIYDDHEWYPVLVCPWCRGHLHEGDVVVVDAGLWETQSSDTTPEDGITFDYDHEPQMETLHYKCGKCDAPVSIPSNVEVN